MIRELALTAFLCAGAQAETLPETFRGGAPVYFGWQVWTLHIESLDGRLYAVLFNADRTQMGIAPYGWMSCDRVVPNYEDELAAWVQLEAWRGFQSGCTQFFQVPPQ